MSHHYAIRNVNASVVPTFVIDEAIRLNQASEMLAKMQLLAAAKGKAKSQAEMARVLGVAPARITEMFKGERELTYEEGRVLAEHYGLIDAGLPRALPLNVSTVAAILRALAPAQPKGDLSEQGAVALAEALTRALELLSETGANEPTDRELAMAVRAATTRFREVAPA